LLQHPELAPSTPDIPEISASEQEDLVVFTELLALLRQRPNYNLSRILGHWRGSKGAAATEALAQLAATDLISHARQAESYDGRQEYLDTITRLEDRLQQDRQKAELEKLSRKNFNELSESEKQQIRDFHTQNQAKGR
jgi:DNA primase